MFPYILNRLGGPNEFRFKRKNSSSRRKMKREKFLFTFNTSQPSLSDFIIFDILKVKCLPVAAKVKSSSKDVDKEDDTDASKIEVFLSGNPKYIS